MAVKNLHPDNGQFSVLIALGKVAATDYSLQLDNTLSLGLHNTSLVVPS